MKILESAEHSCFGVHDERLFLAVFRGRCRTADVTTMRRHLAATLSARVAGDVAVLVVIEYHSTLGERGRGQVAEMLSQASGHVRCWANVVEGEGFWASAFRGITLTVSKLARYKFPLKTFGKVNAAAEWLAAEGFGNVSNIEGDVTRLRESRVAAVGT